ncbi:hypothetical protein ACFQQB_61175 [Nonomuraea rubra]|uniref:hypothetical protein n=1 Tax=Nonomuraea rubra TaxID=46180 RepID=UPI00360F60E9
MTSLDTRQAAQRFADTWQHGWTHHDVAAITALYHDDAVHTSMPFRPRTAANRPSPTTSPGPSPARTTPR